MTVTFASPPSDGRTALITLLSPNVVCFISYVTEVPFPSSEVAAVFCCSAELKKGYFGVSILAYFFFFFNSMTAYVKK